MTKTLVEQYVEDPDHMRAFQQEREIYKTTELIESVMQEKNISRSELARRLGKSKGWVTQLLDGDANKTIRTVADVLAVMGRELRVVSQDICISNAPVRSDAATANGSGNRNRQRHPRLQHNRNARTRTSF